MQYEKGSTDWANLTPVEEAGNLLGEFVVKAFQSATVARTTNPPPYLVDFSIKRLCPKLLNISGFSMPTYVHDLMQDIQVSSTREGNALSTFRDHWPSLFVGSAGTKSGLHRDSIGSFWQLVLKGTKRWIIYDREHQHRLQPDCVRRTFLLDPFTETGDTWRYETILKPGDFLFVPAESPHAVENLEPSLSFAGNFVSEQALAATLKELEIGAGQAPGYSALLTGLRRLQRDNER